MKFLRALSTLALCSAACSDGLPDPVPVQQRVALEAFDSCETLEKYIEDTATLSMRARLTAKKEDEREGNGFGLPIGMAEADSVALNGVPSSGPSAYTTTNVQVKGVDEADFVKNDGTRIFVLSGQRLYLTRSWPAAELSLVGSLDIEGWPREMFLDESNRVVIFSTLHRPNGWVADGDLPCSQVECDAQQGRVTKITVVDVSNMASPRVTRESYLPGVYVSARRIGGSVRIVLTEPFRWPPGVRWTIDDGDGLYEDMALRQGVWDSLMDRNEELIRSANLSDWRPPAQRRMSDGSLVGFPLQCEEFTRPNGPTELGLTTVATLQLDDEGPPSTLRVVADVDEIYASHQSLYVANLHWWWSLRSGQQTYTYLHKFDISQPDRAIHVGSGAVEGRIVDQFSMDEHEGYLRIATTLQTREADGPAGTLRIANRVSVLVERDGALQEVGRTEDLAPGEAIFSARFLGTRGFVVTSTIRMDPLFTFDLSNPAAPRRVGELHVPGFSSYLHPVEDRYLLAMGRDGQGNLKLSLYDVGDFANPAELQTLALGRWGFSEAQDDHRAFNYFPERQLLAVPFWGCPLDHYTCSPRSSLRVLRVEAAQGTLTALGDVDMDDLNGGQSWRWDWSPVARRSVMADDFVYAIGDGGIRVARSDALSSPLKTLAFPR